MKVLAYDKFPKDGLGDGDTVRYTSLDEIFEKSDVISLHCPLTDETYHLIDDESIAKCKKGVVILNSSRGALVDAEALLAGIKSRKVGAACLDVYEEEADFFFEDFSGHILEDDVLARLISMPNVIVTSHQAFLTEEALSNIAETTVKNIVEINEKGESQNEVCYRCGKTEDSSVSKCF
jgi:D-lactate dehydrogenase